MDHRDMAGNSSGQGMGWLAVQGSSKNDGKDKKNLPGPQSQVQTLSENTLPFCSTLSLPFTREVPSCSAKLLQIEQSDVDNNSMDTRDMADTSAEVKEASAAMDKEKQKRKLKRKLKKELKKKEAWMEEAVKREMKKKKHKVKKAKKARDDKDCFTNKCLRPIVTKQSEAQPGTTAADQTRVEGGSQVPRVQKMSVATTCIRISLNAQAQVKLMKERQKKCIEILEAPITGQVEVSEAHKYDANSREQGIQMNTSAYQQPGDHSHLPRTSSDPAHKHPSGEGLSKSKLHDPCAWIDEPIQPHLESRHKHVPLEPGYSGSTSTAETNVESGLVYEARQQKGAHHHTSERESFLMKGDAVYRIDLVGLVAKLKMVARDGREEEKVTKLSRKGISDDKLVLNNADDSDETMSSTSDDSDEALMLSTSDDARETDLETRAEMQPKQKDQPSVSGNSEKKVAPLLLRKQVGSEGSDIPMFEIVKENRVSRLAVDRVGINKENMKMDKENYISGRKRKKHDGVLNERNLNSASH